jgi:NAD(P)-dependent dehydrogenase (short-subunit alcohol dehydrogenase family)
MTFATELLRDQKALVLGGGRGIGRAVCMTLGPAGSAVAVVGIVPGRTPSVANEQLELGGVAVDITAEVFDPSGLDRIIQEALLVDGGAQGRFPFPVPSAEHPSEGS